MIESRKGLGRGIASLIPVRNDSELGALPGSRVYQLIPISKITANPNQPRKFFDEGKIEELSSSIREKGILLPLIVVKSGEGAYEIVSGERRFRAAKKAGLTEVPVLIRDVDSKEVLELAIIENVQREALDPIEESAAYMELMEQHGYTQDEVAQKVGKERSTIANTLRLSKLPLIIKQALQSGQISVGHARALLGVPEIEKQLYYVDRIVTESWSVRELEARIQSKKVLGAKRKTKVPMSLSPALVQILDDLRRKLGTQVRLTPSGKKGKIIIEYYSEMDLDRIYQSLTRP